MKEKVQNYFHLDEVDHHELSIVLLSFFGSATQTSVRSTRYKRDGESQYLDVHWNSKGRIQRIIASSRFTRDEMEKIEVKVRKKLIDNQISAIGQTIGFCKAQVEGYFRYKDLFQIVPVPDDAPKPDVLYADHPFLLQFSYISSPDVQIDGVRRNQKVTILIRLLNLFSNRGLHLSPRYTHFSWVLSTKESNSWTSEWRQVGYTYKEFSGKIDTYSKFDNHFPIERVPFQDYYTSLSARASVALTFPDNLERSLDLALNLGQQEWQTFFMACSWYSQAETIWNESH